MSSALTVKNKESTHKSGEQSAGNITVSLRSLSRQKVQLTVSPNQCIKGGHSEGKGSWNLPLSCVRHLNGVSVWIWGVLVGDEA